MRQSILGFNQSQAVQGNLDLTDLMLLQYIMIANGNPDMKHIIKDEVSYVWLSHAKIHEDLPILNITEGTLRNKLATLKKNNWIISETIRTSTGATTYYSVSTKAMSLTNDVGTEIEEPCHSEMTSPCHSEMTSYNKLEDNKLNSNSTNVELEQATPTRRVLITVNNPVNTETSHSKKKNLYEKCMEEIDNFTDDPTIKSLLLTYFKVRREMEKPLYFNQWKSYINDLKELADNGQDTVEVIKQSINRGYRGFFEVKTPISKKGQDKRVFSEYGKVKTGNSGTGVISNVSF